MKKLLLLSFSALAICCAGVEVARIAEIAPWLAEQPKADGARITDRAAWNRLAALPSAKKRIAAAVEILAEPIPDTPDKLYLQFTQNGNRLNYERCFFKRTGNFEALCIAECLENKGRFIPKIIQYIDAICAMKSWVLPAHDGGLTCFHGKPHVDLFSSGLSAQMAILTDWLGDKLPAATRAKVASEIDRRTFQPHLAHVRGQHNGRHHWFHGGSNWNSVCNCNVVRAALVLVKDRTLRAEFIAAAEESVPYALRGYSEDGYCSEGMGYWNYGYGHHIMMGLAVRAATKGRVDFFANPKTKKVMEYGYNFQIESGVSPHFADGGGNAGAVYLAFGRQIWPDLVNTAALQCDLLDRSAEVFSLRAFGQEPAPVAPTRDILPIRSWFPQAQVLLSRNTTPEKNLKFGIAMKGGHNNELHNHNDVGSYTILLNGCEMVGDPGGEVYTRRTFSAKRYVSKMLNSYGHPVPVVDGQLQSTGGLARGKVLKTEFTATKDALVLDYTSAYPVKGLKSLVRTLTFDRTTNTITISDTVKSDRAVSFEMPVITYRSWSKNADATLLSFVTKKGDRKMNMAVSSSAPVTFREEKIENPLRPDVTRLAFSFNQPVTSATFTTVYTVQ